MKLEERFINYVKIDTMSDEYSSSSPSSMKQFDLAKLLLKELIIKKFLKIILINVIIILFIFINV